MSLLNAPYIRLFMYTHQCSTVRVMVLIEPQSVCNLFSKQGRTRATEQVCGHVYIISDHISHLIFVINGHFRDVICQSVPVSSHDGEFVWVNYSSWLELPTCCHCQYATVIHSFTTNTNSVFLCSLQIYNFLVFGHR